MLLSQEAQRLPTRHEQVLRLVLDLNALLDAVGFARVDLLARLGDGPEHLVIAEVVTGDDDGRLLLERDVIRFDPCAQNILSAFCLHISHWSKRSWTRAEGYANPGVS